MGFDAPPIQNKTADQNGVFPVVWITWLQSVRDEIGRLNGLKRKTTSQTLDNTAYTWFFNTDGGNLTAQLPAGVDERSYRIVNTGSSGNSLTVTPDGLEKIYGVNGSQVLADDQDIILSYSIVDGWY